MSNPIDEDFYVCTDCYEFHHHGNTPENKEDARRVRMAFNLLAKDEYYMADNTSEDEDPGYSRSSCDCCCSGMGGMRYRMSLFQEKPKKLRSQKSLKDKVKG
jgi:hypothetical protein